MPRLTGALMIGIILGVILLAFVTWFLVQNSDSTQANRDLRQFCLDDLGYRVDTCDLMIKTFPVERRQRARECSESTESPSEYAECIYARGIWERPN